MSVFDFIFLTMAVDEEKQKRNLIRFYLFLVFFVNISKIKKDFKFEKFWRNLPDSSVKKKLNFQKFYSQIAVWTFKTERIFW